MKRNFLTLLFLLTGFCVLAQSVSMRKSDIVCNGSCDGTAIAVPSGGTPPYNYLWNNSSTNQIITGLCAGAYTVTISDANFNTATNSITINEPTVISANFTTNDVSCNGGNDGDIDLTASGASPNRSISVDGGNDYVEANTVTEAGYANGITIEAWVWPDPAATNEGVIAGFNDDPTGNLCWISYFPNTDRFNAYDVNASNRTSANTFPPGNWYHVAMTIDGANNKRLYVDGVLEGTESAINNAWQPQVADYFSIAQEYDGVFNISQLFFGRIDEVRVWNTPLSAATLLNHATNCCPVTPSHTNYANLVSYFRMNEGSGTNVGDSRNGNSGRLINGNTWATSAQTDYTCYGTGTGYTFDWSNSATTEDINTLTAGTYTVTITDGNCCTLESSATVTEPNVLTVADTVTNASCNGSTDGNATANPTGGTTPYGYQWSANAGSQTTQTATGLGAGTYTVTVTDDNGCTAATSITVTEPSALTIATDSTELTCNGDGTGTATANGVGGTSPYSYQWDAQANNQTTQTATGLQAGNYSVTLTDDNGCTIVTTATVTEPTILSPTAANTVDATCNGDCDGTTNVPVSGGTMPYTFQWDAQANNQTDSLATGLCAGTYSVTITDGNGCDTVVTATVAEPTPVIQNISPNVSICEGDSVTLDVTGGATWDWSNTETTQSITVSPTADITYTVTVSDGGACTETASVSVVVDTFLVISAFSDTTISIGEEANLSANGGATYEWTPSTGLDCDDCQNPTATPEETTIYYVTDPTNCSTIDSVIVEVLEFQVALVPNIFSPNNDGQNDILYVRGGGISTLRFIIFDRWGNKVFETNDQSIGWDGTYKGDKANTGVYVYLVEASFFNGTDTKTQGNVTLIR